MRRMELDAGIKNIMVIVPHEDDEILLAAGIMEKALAKGIGVHVVMAGNGDYEGHDEATGSVRLPETLAGLQVLGLGGRQVTFLGYADTGMDETESFLHQLYDDSEGDRVHVSHCSDHTYALPDKKDYHAEKYGKPALYTRNRFKQDLKEIIMEKRPEIIFTTAEYDRHGDHSGLVFFIKEILTEEKEYHPPLFSGVVHSNAGDENWPNRSAKRDNIWDYAKSMDVCEPFACPKDFDKGLLKWEERISFAVPEDMQALDFSVNRKARALACHKNAIKEDAVEFLYAFIKREELFWEIVY